jgi:hypothetical protein
VGGADADGAHPARPGGGERGSQRLCIRIGLADELIRRHHRDHAVGVAREHLERAEEDAGRGVARLRFGDDAHVRRVRAHVIHLRTRGDHADARLGDHLAQPLDGPGEERASARKERQELLRVLAPACRPQAGSSATGEDERVGVLHTAAFYHGSW